MLKRRIIPALFIQNGLIVRSEGFAYHQNIGNVINEAARYNEWDVDELIYLDISRQESYDSRRDDHKVKSLSTLQSIIEAISKVCFMPLTFGGRIRSVEDVALRIKSGADKVAINSEALKNPALISDVSRRYGSQCVVAGVDYRIEEGVPVIYGEQGRLRYDFDMLDWVDELVRRGAGEVFLNSIDRDGMAEGFDLETLSRVSERCPLPVIACGGAGSVEDFIEVARETQVSAIAAGNFFHFTERSYPQLKKKLRTKDFNVR